MFKVEALESTMCPPTIVKAFTHYSNDQWDVEDAFLRGPLDQYDDEVPEDHTRRGQVSIATGWFRPQLTKVRQGPSTLLP